jgi:transposase InsO family protein
MALPYEAKHEPTGQLLSVNAPVERLFRSLKSEWIPSTGYTTFNEAQRDISYYLMTRYNWLRPHQFNDGLAPAKAEENFIHCPESVDHYSYPNSTSDISPY